MFTKTKYLHKCKKILSLVLCVTNTRKSHRCKMHLCLLHVMCQQYTQVPSVQDYLSHVLCVTGTLNAYTQKLSVKKSPTANQEETAGSPMITLMLKKCP